MASKNEDVHLRLFFDGAKAQKTYNMLVALQEEYNKKLQEAKKAAQAKGVDWKSDPDVKAIQGKLTIVKSILKETKKSYTDIHNALSHLSEQSMSDLNSYAKYLEHRINSMNMKRKGAKQELDKLKNELQQINDERASRNGTNQNRTLAEIQKDLSKSDLSINKLRSLRQELDHLRNSTSSSSTRLSAGKEIADLDARIKQMNTQPLRDLDVVLANIGNANNASISRLKELREELVLIQQNSTDSSKIQRATDGIAELDSRIASMTKHTVSSADAEKIYAEAQALSRKGQKATVGEINKTIASLKALSAAENTTAADAQKYNALISQLEASLRGASAASRKLAYDETFVASTLKNIKFASMEDLEKSMLMLKNRMRDAQTSLKDYITTSIQLRQVQANIRNINNDLSRQGDWFTTNAKKLLNYLGVFGGFYLVRQELTKLFQLSMKYDDQLTNIQKTTNLTDKQLRLMAEGIKRIDTRTSVEELQNLAYQSGKLGIKGVSDLLGFVRAADMLRVSLGEQLGDDAAEKLMKIANIMGDTSTYGLEEALTRTGSAITYMAKNSAASGDAIVSFMSRTAGLSRQAGITSSELTGLAAAVSALGQPVEMSATSFSKMMVQMEKSYKTVGAALKMTDREMETMRLNLESGRGMEAFLDMLKRVKEMGGLSNTASIAKDLGSEGSRVIQTLTTLSSSYDTIARMVHQSTDAFEENITVQEEYKKKNQNTAALYEKLVNNFNKLFVSQDANEWFRSVLEKLQVLPDAVKQLVDNFRGLATVVGGFLVNHITGLVNALSSLLYILGTRSVARSILGTIFSVTASLGTFSKTIIDNSIPAIRRYNIALQGNIGFFKAATIHAQKFFYVCKAASLGNALFTLVTVLTTIYQLFLNNEKEVTNWADSTASAVDRVKRASSETTEKMESLVSALSQENIAEEESLRIKSELQEMFKDYIGNLDLTAMGWREVEAAVRGANEQMQANQILEATQAHIKEIRQTDTEEQAPGYGKLIEQVKQRLTATDEQTLQNQAVAIVNAMIKNPDMYVGAKNSKGEFTKNKYYSGALDPEEFKIQSNVNALYRSVAGEGFVPINQLLQTYVNNADNQRERHRQGVDVDFVDNLQDLFVPFANSLANTEKSVNDAIIYGNAQANMHVEKAMPWLKEMMDSQYSLFSQAFTRGGKFDPTQVRKERSGKDTQDATTDDWARDKRASQDEKQRSVEIAAANNWLVYANNYIKDLRQQNGDKQDTAEITAMQNEISNVRAWLKIWDIGDLRNVDPNSKGAEAKARRDARQEMDNLIQKIKTFYEIQANAYKEMRQKQQITETEYKRYLEQNQRDLSHSLSDAYAALAQDADMTEERYAQITERMRQENQRSGAGAIGETQIGIVSDTSYASVQNINKVLSGDKENGTAWTNSMRRKRREEEGNITESLNNEMQERIKAWLEQNPIGKIAQDFQKQFEEMGLLINIKPEINIDGSTIRNLDQVQNDLMKQMLEIGKHVSVYDVTTEQGRREFAAYVKDLERFPDVARTAVMENDADISAFYYKVYEYAEQYEEQLKRITDRTLKMWDKMYEAGDEHQGYQQQIRAIDQLKKKYAELEKFGLNDLFAIDINVKSAVAEYNDALSALEDKAKRARAHMQSAQAMEVGSQDKDGKNVTAQYRDAEIASAQAELDALQAEGEAVVAIYGKVLDAQQAVREKTWQWLAEMKDGFESFADSFVPLRKWYEDKGSFVENVFGTKAERQAAFDDFITNLKKAVRETMMEQAKLAMNQWVLKSTKKAEEAVNADKQPAQDAVDGIVCAATKDFQVTDIDSLRANKDGRLQLIMEYHLSEEEEERRHVAIMNEINGRGADGSQTDDEETQRLLDLKQAGFSEELSIEQMQQQTKLAMQQQAEQKLEELTRRSVNKLFKVKQKGAKDEFKVAQVTAKDRAKVEEAANEEVGKSSEDLFDVQAQIANAAKNIRIKNSQETKTKEEADNVESASVGMWGSFGEAVAKAWAQGGPYLGPVLAAVVSAAVGGLITMVMNMMGSSSKAASTSGAKTKLVSGMLTYDDGNAQSFPVMGDDGRVYRVSHTQSQLSTGMVTQPTLTTVGGVPALVGERGPEMVIGRETTQAMMMSRPDLIRQIVEFDRNRSRGFAKTFDSGNVNELGARSEELGVGSSAAPNGITPEQIEANTAVMAALLARLDQPIRAEFNMNGRGGAADQMAQGLLNSRRLGDLESVKRLFGARG